jgi:antitoxin Phd
LDKSQEGFRFGCIAINIYTFTEARQKLAALLDQAVRQGEVRIKRRDGQVFIRKPQKIKDTSLNVAGLELGISMNDILQSIEDGRKRD